MLLPVIITRWFSRHMGLALGIYWAGFGIGPMILAPLFRWLIETRGWPWTFTFIGIVLGVTLLAFPTLIRSSAEEKGLKPYGAEDGAADRAAVTGPPHANFRQILKQRPAWLLVGIHHLGCVGHAVILACSTTPPALTRGRSSHRQRRSALGLPLALGLPRHQKVFKPRVEAVAAA